MNEKAIGRYVVHLIYSLIDHKPPDEKPEDISFEDIFHMSAKHNVCVMTLCAIDHLEKKPGKELYQQWNKKRNIAIAQSVVQLKERDVILDAFDRHQIRNIPLKGCLLKEMYPRPEYREMSDLDILTDESDRHQIKGIMESLGYIAEDFGAGKDDSYRKDPFMNVEIHNRLLESITSDRLSISADPLAHPFDHAFIQSGAFSFRMTWEDFYLYLLAHTAKHYMYAGCGIRQFIDFDIFSREHKVNKQYVDQILADSNIWGFAQNAEKLIQCWRNRTVVPAELEEMEAIIFSAGSYGSRESRIRNNIRRSSEYSSKTTFSYLLFRFFPPYELMKAKYPVLKKMPIFLPVFWIYRFASKGIPNIKKFYEELIIHRNIQRDDN